MDNAMESEPENTRPIQLLQVRGRPGYLTGWRQPAVTLDMRITREASPEALRQLSRVTQNVAPEALPTTLTCRDSDSPTVHRIADELMKLLCHSGWPVFHRPQVYRRSSDQHIIRLIVPSVRGGEQAIANVVSHLVNQLNATDSTPDDSTLRRRLDELDYCAPAGINTLRFLQAAEQYHIPWQRLAGNLYQFGWGRNARWLDSSFTDATPQIASRIARDKRLSSTLLRQAGLPVPPQRSARTVDQALQAARSLGFPVVVKPADRDGGRGVHAFLCSEEEVTDAFREAAKISSSLIVEKYFEGNDYRVQVFQGHAYSVNQRVPASVTGDGTSTVRELVDMVNEDPQRGPPGSALLRWLVLDEEAVKWLERQSLTVDSVPARNQFVRLRGAANIATGGSLEPVLAHPDNLRLAERAVNLLRLDLAGVDLLIPDIRESWHDTGAVICEVNAQPQMAPDLPEQVLPKLMKGNGRVPVILVLGEMDEAALPALENAMARHYGQVGSASAEGVRIGGLSTSVMPGDSFAAAQFLIRDPSVDCILLQVRDNAILQRGSPFDRIDHLIVADDLPHSSRAQRLQISALRLMLTATADHAWILQDTSAPGIDSRYTRIRPAEITHIITAAHTRKKTKP